MCDLDVKLIHIFLEMKLCDFNVKLIKIIFEIRRRTADLLSPALELILNRSDDWLCASASDYCDGLYCTLLSTPTD